VRLAEVLSPLRVPGIVLDLRSPEATVVGDAALLRFTFATLVRQCETDALERNRMPEVPLTVEESEGAVHVLITGGGRTSVMTAPERGLDLTDAEMSVVHAIVALHGGVLVSAAEKTTPRHGWIHA
jgi:hypothetical protein